MARPEEKAQAMMNKWTTMKESYDEGIGRAGKKKRPYLASLCETLYESEQWRREIIREISNGIRDIQNSGMGEHAVRDLNDKINKLFREKYHWNRRIIELGGPNYNAIERKRIRDEEESQGLKGSGGYRYFGAAKDLPGVKELFAKQAGQAVSTKRKRAEIVKNITPDYYGIRDEEDDGVLLTAERKQEEKNQLFLEQELEEYVDKCKEDGVECFFSTEEGQEDFLPDEDIDITFSAEMAIPPQELMTQITLERKKSQLLSKLAF